MDTTVSVVMYDIRMPSIRGGISGWNIDLYSTRMDQSDCSISRAYVINVYNISIHLYVVMTHLLNSLQ